MQMETYAMEVERERGMVKEVEKERGMVMEVEREMVMDMDMVMEMDNAMVRFKNQFLSYIL